MNDALKYLLIAGAVYVGYRALTQCQQLPCASVPARLPVQTAVPNTGDLERLLQIYR